MKSSPSCATRRSTPPHGDPGNAARPRPGPRRPPGTARVTGETSDSLTVEADLPKAAVLLVTDTYCTGWQARSLLPAGANGTIPVHRAARRLLPACDPAGGGAPPAAARIPATGVRDRGLDDGGGAGHLRRADRLFRVVARLVFRRFPDGPPAGPRHRVDRWITSSPDAEWFGDQGARRWPDRTWTPPPRDVVPP